MSVGPPTLAERKTPYSDKWVESIRPVFDEYGSRSEFARFVEGEHAPHGKIVRWTNTIARWLARTELPSLESYFLVQSWMAGRRKGKGQKAAPKRSA